MDSTSKALIQAYLEKSSRKLTVAEQLLQSGDYEDAVSRAYYSVFHAAQALLLMEGQKAESHKGVLTLFALLFVKTGRFERKYGKILADLKDDRESGDYEVLSYTEEDSAREALLQAKEFVLGAREYLVRAGID